eukprot:8096505-Alexandrium_andersonii.AAC.1
MPARNRGRSRVGRARFRADAAAAPVLPNDVCCHASGPPRPRTQGPEASAPQRHGCRPRGPAFS